MQSVYSTAPVDWAVLGRISDHICNRSTGTYQTTPSISSKVCNLSRRLPKAPFSIATTPRCRGGRNSFSWIAPLYPWSLPYNAEYQARRHEVPFLGSLVWLDLGLLAKSGVYWFKKKRKPSKDYYDSLLGNSVPSIPFDDDDDDIILTYTMTLIRTNQNEHPTHFFSLRLTKNSQPSQQVRAVEYAESISAEESGPHPNESFEYDTKLSDGEAQVQELWGMWSILSLPLRSEWKYLIESHLWIK